MQAHTLSRLNIDDTHTLAHFSPTTSSFQDLKVVGYKLDFSFTCMQRQQVERPSGFFTIINYSKDKASFRMLGVNYLCRWGMLGL
jgi:hypothetical protein